MKGRIDTGAVVGEGKLDNLALGLDINLHLPNLWIVMMFECIAD